MTKKNVSTRVRRPNFFMGIAGPKNAGLIKGNQWVFIVPDHKASYFLGGETVALGGVA